jgi:hypothetical protein
MNLEREWCLIYLTTASEVLESVCHVFSLSCVVDAAQMYSIVGLYFTITRTFSYCP